MTLRDIVQESDTKAGRVFDSVILVLIISSIIMVTFETLPDLSPAAKRAFYIFEAVTVVLFTIEFVLRIVTAPKVRGYIFSFHGIIDLIAILPFYLTVGFGAPCWNRSSRCPRISFVPRVPHPETHPI